MSSDAFMQDPVRVEGPSASGASKRVLLFVAPEDALSRNLVFAIEREFPALRVEHATNFLSACQPLGAPVPLILIGSSFIGELAGWRQRISQAHPSAMLALLQEDDRRPLKMRDLQVAGNVCGVLPMNLKLDIWLLVISLLLRGGEYFPPSLYRTHQEPNGHDAHVRGEMNPSDDQVAPPTVTTLTERERQILKLASRGLPNKLIAAELGLSEHTVKIHMHNIIRKLGAHNRTAAAAIYLRFRDLAEGGLPKPPMPNQN